MNLLLSDLVWLFAIGVLLLLWWQSMQIRERAMAAVKKRCGELDLQFLDQNVALRKFGLRRGSKGSLQIQRVYAFEFSSTGEERYEGQVEVRGQRIVSIKMQPHRLQ